MVGAFGGRPSGPAAGASGWPHPAGWSPSHSRADPRTSCPSGTVTVIRASRSNEPGNRASGTDPDCAVGATGMLASSTRSNGCLWTAASRTERSCRGPSDFSVCTPSTTSGGEGSSDRHSAGTSTVSADTSVRIGVTWSSTRTRQPGSASVSR